jgi:hypothetical protein
MSVNNYFWIRVFDYVYDRDTYEKGTMLDEFYVIGDRETAKQQVKELYCSSTSNSMRFAKPKKSDGIYAVVIDSDKFFYDRFYKGIDTLCFWCHKEIKGKAAEFPREYIGEGKRYDHDEFCDETAYFCSYDCRTKLWNSQHPSGEGEFQVKEAGQNGDVFGYIYLIYNRSEDTYYIGQTRYMPFFRWQEHVKDGGKGELSDLSFSVLAKVCRDRQENDEQNQIYLNNIEAWWIAKYQHEKYKTFNVTKPKITIEDLKNRFNDMVIRQERLC